MGKKKKNEMCEADIDFEIQETEVLLDKLKKQKEKFTIKPIQLTQFEDLPVGIENIAAHIAIREHHCIYIIKYFDSFELFSPEQLADSLIEYDSEGIVHIDCSWNSFSFGKYIDELVAPFFGCVIIPKNGNEYTIEPLTINNGEIVLENF